MSLVSNCVENFTLPKIKIKNHVKPLMRMSFVCDIHNLVLVVRQACLQGGVLRFIPINIYFYPLPYNFRFWIGCLTKNANCKCLCFFIVPVLNSCWRDFKVNWRDFKVNHPFCRARQMV